MIKELTLAIKHFDIYHFLARQDVKSRFRRSRLGILWIIIQQLVYSLGVGLVWTKIFGMDPAEFIPFLTVGMTLWTFISAAMVEGSVTFVTAHGYLKQLPLPQSIFIFRTLFTQGFYLAVGMTTVVFVLLVFGKFRLMGIIYAIPGFCILVAYFYGASGAFAYLGLRYRDLQHALSSIFSMLFIVTPVMYPPEILIKKGIAIVVYGNPFASLIEVVRMPLLTGSNAAPIHYIIALIFTVIMIMLRFIVAKKWERFVPFWS